METFCLKKDKDKKSAFSSLRSKAQFQTSINLKTRICYHSSLPVANQRVGSKMLLAMSQFLSFCLWQ